MVIAALISSSFIPTAGPISVKSVHNRQALVLQYPVSPRKICCVSCAPKNIVNILGIIAAFVKV
jgi:hypothetical protein